jgi:NAD(P)H dehydrogenase (quinone)
LDRPASRALGIAEVTRVFKGGTSIPRGHHDHRHRGAGAFEGADQLLLVSSNDPSADAVRLHRAAIDATVAVDVGRILYTSHQGAALDTPFKPGRDHAATEQLPAASGIPWTSLRNGFYAHSLNWPRPLRSFSPRTAPTTCLRRSPLLRHRRSRTSPQSRPT